MCIGDGSGILVELDVVRKIECGMSRLTILVVRKDDDAVHNISICSTLSVLFDD